MAQIIFIRHGETVWNTEGREMGQLDSALTARGMQQAEAIAERLRGMVFSMLYSSDLGRAIKTAECISRHTGHRVQKDIGLRERHMGIFQGLTRAEMAARYPNEWASYNSAEKFTYVIPTGESQKQRLARSVEVMDRLADKHPDETIVVVSHGGILRGFFEHVLGLEPGNEHRFKRRNATFNSFTKKEGHWSLEVWGDASHLEGVV
jgi:broad specificity phosphatase PhoE